MKFAEAEKDLAESGYIPLNPTKIEYHGLTHYEYLKISISLLSCADCIYIIDGKETSSGVKTEMIFAEANRIPEIEKANGKWFIRI